MDIICGNKSDDSFVCQIRKEAYVGCEGSNCKIRKEYGFNEHSSTFCIMILQIKGEQIIKWKHGRRVEYCNRKLLAFNWFLNTLTSETNFNKSIIFSGHSILICHYSLYCFVVELINLNLLPQQLEILHDSLYTLIEILILCYSINIGLNMYRFQSGRMNIFNQERRPSNIREYSQRCPNCRKVKEVLGHTCKIPCIYCHDLHSTNELTDNLCPVMFSAAKKAQEKNSYVCKVCTGEGSYAEETETIRYESTKKFEARLKQWNFLKGVQQNQEIQKPSRKILFQQKRMQQLKCGQCEGRGRIIRIVPCCALGCGSCNGDKFKMNPVWKKYRTEPVLNQVEFNCSICLMDVQQNEDKFTLQCKHEFHYNCIFKWLKTKSSCPVCRQRDIFLQGMDLPANNQNERRVMINRAERSFSEVNDSWETYD